MPSSHRTLLCRRCFRTGFFILSWLTLPFYDLLYATELNNSTNNTLCGGTVYIWSNWGILAGLFQDLALTFSFLAIPKVGLSIGQGVWGGTSIIVAVILGIVVQHDAISSPAGLGFALVILIGSIVGIAFCNEIGAKFAQLKNPRGSAGACCTDGDIFSTDGCHFTPGLPH